MNTKDQLFAAMMEEYRVTPARTLRDDIMIEVLRAALPDFVRSANPPDDHAMAKAIWCITDAIIAERIK